VPTRTDSPRYEHVKLSLLNWYSYPFEKTDCPEEELRELALHRSAVDIYATARILLRFEGGRNGLGPETTRPGDKLCVILECELPLILRCRSDKTWSVIGEGYAHGMMDGEALLGVLPNGVRRVERQPETSDYVYRSAFINTKTNHIQVEDPRLTEPLPSGWELQRHENEKYEQLFIHKETGHATWRDRRLTPEALCARGVNLRTFKLL